MSAKTIIDARGGDFIVAEGKSLRLAIREHHSKLKTAYGALIERMTNEVKTKEEAVTLLVSMFVSPQSLNERALFIKACLERAAYLEDEMKYLHTMGIAFEDTQVYQITAKDLQRFGL